MPFSFNGIGTTYYGKRDVQKNGSYITTKWVIFLHIPIVPLCSLRVLPKDRGWLGNPTSYWTWEAPLCRQQIRNTYLAVLLVGLAFASLFLVGTNQTILPIYMASVLCAGITYVIISNWQRTRAKRSSSVRPVDAVPVPEAESTANDDKYNPENPLNLQLKIQIDERQFEKREPLNLISNSLQLQLRELAQIAWTTEDSFRYPQFLLNPNDLAQITTPDIIVEVLLRHVERIAPGFNVPYMVPRVLVTPLAFVAGLFEVDEEGWVTIKVGSQFFANRLAAHAILAHEVCHYILENSGIRKTDFTLNERYTDLCMFVCGLGQIFLAGYKEDSAQREYRPGHRLGYLTDAEYESAQQYVMQLRQSGELAPPSELDTLKKQLAQLVYDAETCNRIIKAARKKYPHKSELELYRDAIERLERDRGR